MPLRRKIHTYHGNDNFFNCFPVWKSFNNKSCQLFCRMEHGPFRIEDILFGHSFIDPAIRAYSGCTFRQWPNGLSVHHSKVFFLKECPKNKFMASLLSIRINALCSLTLVLCSVTLRNICCVNPFLNVIQPQVICINN